MMACRNDVIIRQGMAGTIEGGFRKTAVGAVAQMGSTFKQLNQTITADVDLSGNSSSIAIIYTGDTNTTDWVFNYEYITV